MIHFIADTHFNHKKIIDYCDRPFNDVEEMNQVLIEKWNKKVKSGDTVYHLGDFGFGDYNDFFKQLIGNIVLIHGSHDKQAFNYKKNFVKISSLLEIRTKYGPIILCHYAMRVWSKSHYNSWHLYGHSHNGLAPQGKSFDVGVDANNFEPISLDEVKAKMDTLPDNFNLIKK